MSKKVIFNESVFGEFLARHDLDYSQPPSQWERGVPMANSLVSAMIWGDDRIKVTMARGDVWEMRRYHPDPGKFTWNHFKELLKEGGGHPSDLSGVLQTARDFGPVPQNLPIGRFEILPRGKQILDYQMRLHLYDAVTEGRITTECGGLRWKCHVSAEYPLIIFNYETFGGEEADVRFRFTSVKDEFLDEYRENGFPNRFKGLNRGYDRKNLPEVSQILRDWGYPEPVFSEQDGCHLFSQQIPENGNYCVGWKDIAVSDREHTLVVTVTQDSENGNAEQEACTNLGQFCSQREIDLEEAGHKRWWHEFYPKSFFSVNDTKLEGLYWINIYKLGCLTRSDGMAMPMSGLWIPDNTMAPWGNTYIWNTQQEMPFYGTFVGNRLDTQKTTYQLLIDHRDEMRHIGEDFFGVKDGEYLVHMTDYKLGCPNYSADHFQNVSGPWMMQMMWNYYRFSMDTDFLKDHLYSMMKAQCRVLMALLEKGDDGKLHFPWTMSAEYPPMGGHLGRSMVRFGPDAVSDLSYTVWICETLLKAAEILGTDDEEKTEWQYVLDHIAPFTYDEFGGLKVRADMPLLDSHRHLSHLFPITQTHQINPDTEEGMKTIRNCLHSLQVAGTGEWMGWTFPETGKIAQLAGEAPMAYSLIREYADKYVLENTMDTNGSRDNRAFTYHVGFGLTIDSDGMFNEALQNFAVNSYNGMNYIFCCVPKELTNISFYHFRTEGAFLVSGNHENGKSRFISVESQLGGEFRMVSGLGTDIEITCGETRVSFQNDGRSISFMTEPGKEYIITPKGMSEDLFVIKPEQPKNWEINFFGCKK